MVGRAIAARTLGATSEGPGPIKVRCGGKNELVNGVVLPKPEFDSELMIGNWQAILAQSVANHSISRPRRVLFAVPDAPQSGKPKHSHKKTGLYPVSFATTPLLLGACQQPVLP